MELAIAIGIIVFFALITVISIALLIYDHIRKGRVKDDVYREVDHLINVARYDNNAAERKVARNRIRNLFYKKETLPYPHLSYEKIHDQIMKAIAHADYHISGKIDES